MNQMDFFSKKFTPVLSYRFPQILLMPATNVSVSTLKVQAQG